MRTPLTTSLAAALLLSASGPDDTVALHLAPVPGAVSAHSVEISRTIEGGDLAVIMDGNEVPSEFLPDLSFEFTVATKAEITDQFLPPEDDIAGPWRKRTLEDLSRSFDMSVNYSGQTREMTAEASCELDGEPFLIGRDEDGDVVARWTDPKSKVDAQLLDRAQPELHLERLLQGQPDRLVGAGATWEADASALAGLLDLSGTLPWTWSGDGASEIPGPSETTFEGDLELKVVDVRTENGAVFCTISLAGEILETSTRAADLEQVPVADGTATETTTTTYTIEGELVWNVTAAHLAAFRMEGEGEGEQVTLKDPGQPGPEYSSTTQHTAQLEVELK